MKTARLTAEESQPVEALQKYASVLLPLDGSELAAQAIPQAVDLAQRHGARLILLCVVPGAESSPQTAPTPYSSLDRERDARRSQAEGYLAAMKRLLQRSGVVIETRIEEGPTAPTILRVAHALGPVVIVSTKRDKIAAHGTQPASDLSLVSDEIARDWDGPLVLVEQGEGGH